MRRTKLLWQKSLVAMATARQNSATAMAIVAIHVAPSWRKQYQTVQTNPHQCPRVTVKTILYSVTACPISQLQRDYAATTRGWDLRLCVVSL